MQNSLQMQPCPAFHLLLYLSNKDWSDLPLSGQIILVSAEVQNNASTPVRSSAMSNSPKNDLFKLFMHWNHR